MNTHRYIARFIVEAETPLFVGSGEASLITDALVQRDFNGLPMIYGTSLAGVLRHALEDYHQVDNTDWNKIFGYQEKKKGSGARLKISNAYMMLNETRCAEGLQKDISSEILYHYRNLPVRQHVKINEKGTALKGGLFDNEVVYKGTRFIFEIELIGNENEELQWKKIINALHSPHFRIGQGTRNGYGKLKVHQSFEKTNNLKENEDFEAYTEFDPSLNSNDFANFKLNDDEDKSSDFIKYKLELEPDSLFFNFSSGYGDTDVDNTPLTEEIAIYSDNQIDLKERTVIPASSIKGALSHRVCFHYNKLKEKFADNLSQNEYNKYIGANNQALFSLFGGESSENKLEKTIVTEKGEKKEIHLKKMRGRVLLDDLYYTDIDNEKILNHVAIDRFTGGGIDGALFSERVSYKADNKIDFTIYIAPFQDDEEGRLTKAFEKTLEDLCRGLLPLGGMTTKGNGIFVGNYSKNNVLKFEYGK
jgi:CRISPR/Cas system CSM-associated protein Csm3 (group 7 of RAMP superfamily)